MGLIDRLAADVTCLKGALRTRKATTPIAKHPTRVFPTVVEDLAERYRDAPALLSDRECFGYRELSERSNRYARWALAQGLGKGETICLLMPNRPEFMALWLGVTRVGGVVALVNTHLTGPALAYCIDVVHPRHIVVADVLLAQFDTARAHITSDAKLWLHGEADANLPRIDREVDALPGDRLTDGERRRLTNEDRALYIYTSGTTGLPKAANVNHYRLMLGSHGFSGVMDTRASDRMYDCLPMYHFAGGVVATGAVLINGGSVVLRERFSAHEFWDGTARWSNISASCAVTCSIRRRIRGSASASCASPAATACVPKSGRSSRAASVFRKSSSVTARPKATLRCLILTARKAPSAAFPGSSRTASPPRWCASTSRPSSRSATSMAFASSVPSTSPARSWARS